jgi:flagellar basal body-associated protein FliL
MLTGGGTHEIVEPGETPKPAEAEPLQFGEVVELDDIVINPAGSRRVFMVKVTLEVVDKEKSREVEKRQALLRDNLITLFASQPLEVLIDIKYRQAFRARVKKIMDFQLGEGVVSRVFFEKWVFQ